MGDRERFQSKLLGSVERKDIPTFFTGTEPEGKSPDPFGYPDRFASDMGMRTSGPAGCHIAILGDGEVRAADGLPRPEQAAN